MNLTILKRTKNIADLLYEWFLCKIFATFFQVYNARRFNVDMSEMPVIEEILNHLSELEPFKKAHPKVQPDGGSDNQNF